MCFVSVLLRFGISLGTCLRMSFYVLVKVLAWVRGSGFCWCVMACCDVGCIRVYDLDFVVGLVIVVISGFVV